MGRYFGFNISVVLFSKCISLIENSQSELTKANYFLYAFSPFLKSPTVYGYTNVISRVGGHLPSILLPQTLKAIGDQGFLPHSQPMALTF